MRRDKQIDQFNEINPVIIIDSTDTVASNDNDTTIPTSAAVIDYVAANVGSTTPTCISVANYETADRYQAGGTGTGTATIPGAPDGAILTTGATGNSTATVEYYCVYNTNPFLGNPVVTFRWTWYDTPGTDITMWFVLGTNTATGRHIGFKVLRTSSGDINLYATQADGTTENASSVLTTFGAGDFDDVDLMFRINNTSVDYWWRKSGGALSAATNLTANMPATATSTALTCSVANNAVASDTQIMLFSSSYQR